MTPPPESPIIYDVTLAELLALPKKQEIGPNITQYNTARPQEAIRTLREAASNKQRVEIIGWDSNTGMMINFMSNPGHSPGVSAKYFLEEMDKHAGRKLGVEGASRLLSQELINQSDVISSGHIDFFQINVYKK
jgi:hypothetical protein